MTMHLEPDDVLDGKYRILQRLGAGGFGDVYLAEDQLLGRRVAVKLLRARDVVNEDDLVHEMRSLAQLDQPGVVTFFHHFRENDVLFLVMEYCPGGSLRNKMEAGPVATSEALSWCLDIANTLERVHDRGIVHHDIKPDNILFSAEGLLKVGDFGGANRLVFTPLFAAPEHFFGRIGARDRRLDIYSLGITLCELTLGRNPFDEMSREEIQHSKLRHDFVRFEMPRWVRELILKATHPTPELRFQSMREFAEAIESRRVSYSFDRSSVQAHALAVRAARLVSRGRIASASKAIRQALHAREDCVAALVAEGRIALLTNEIISAAASFDRALSLNPRANIQKELGWVSIERRDYSRAISFLTDHLQRNGADYEAFNLLLECFFRTERYEEGAKIAKMMIDERVVSTCFHNNGLLCCALNASPYDEFLSRKLPNPFLKYNLRFAKAPAEEMRRFFLFQDYRFGSKQWRRNEIVIQCDGLKRSFSKPLVSIGRGPTNEVCLSDDAVSRLHCVIINSRDDVWIHDLGSTYGVSVDGSPVERKAPLRGVHKILTASTEILVSSEAGLLA